MFRENVGICGYLTAVGDIRRGNSEECCALITGLVIASTKKMRIPTVKRIE